MNALPNDAIGYFINFLDFNSVKNFLLASKDLHRITIWSPRYLSAYLSSYYMGAMPLDAKTAGNVHLHVKNIFESIASKGSSIDRPVSIRGTQLQDLPDSVRQSTKPMIPLYLHLKNLEDVVGANDAQNASLLPCVHKVAYSNIQTKYLNEDLDDKLEEEGQQILTLLEKMPNVEELALLATAIFDKNKESFAALKPCESIKKVMLFSTSNLVCNEDKAAAFLEKFPKVEKLTFNGYYHDLRTGPGPIVKDSSVKELCFTNSNIKAHNLRYLLTVLPTVEKISFLQHNTTRDMLTSYCGSMVVDPIDSVKEVYITTDEKEVNEVKSLFSEMLKPHFPNLQKLEINLSDKPKGK